MAEFINDTLRSHVNAPKIVNDTAEKVIVQIKRNFNKSVTGKNVDSSQQSQKSCQQRNKRRNFIIQI